MTVNRYLMAIFLDIYMSCTSQNICKLNIAIDYEHFLASLELQKRYSRMFLTAWVTVFSRMTVSAKRKEFSSRPTSSDVATLICSLWVRSRQEASCELSSRLLLVFTTPCNSSVTIASRCLGSGNVAISIDIFCAIFLMILVVVIMSPP